jgi:hypothetical protein
MRSSYNRITKITADHITYGPTGETLDEVEVFSHAGEL